MFRRAPGSLNVSDMAIWPFGTRIAWLPCGVVPKRALWMYSPGAISLRARRFLFSSVTAVRLPAGTDFAGKVVSTMSPPAMESLRVVPAGTA